MPIRIKICIYSTGAVIFAGTEKGRKDAPLTWCFNIDVLTFGRLCYRVFEELQIELKETIDDTGKNLIVRKYLII